MEGRESIKVGFWLHLILGGGCGKKGWEGLS
jgi:hypothetical protein